MKFDKYLPGERLKPYIKYFVISESDGKDPYKVFPSSGLVMGFQYKGQLATITGNNNVVLLSKAGITGISDTYKYFRNHSDTGTILVYFTETGFTHFTSLPANEFFNLSLSLDEVFGVHSIEEIQEKLSYTCTDIQRIQIVETFLISHLKHLADDKLVTEAVRLISLSKVQSA